MDGWDAMYAWNLAYLYGNVPLARAAVEKLGDLGWPTSGMVKLVEDHWRGVEAAQTGWAVTLDAKSQS